MPLEKQCERYKGQVIFVLPIGGFGWSCIDISAPELQPGVSIDTPSAFLARIIEFSFFNDAVAGGVAVIEDANHPLNGDFVGFCLRDRGHDMYDLTSNPGKYNIEIGKTKPTICVDLDKPMAHWMQFEGSSIVSGLGYIAESEKQISEKFPWFARR